MSSKVFVCFLLVVCSVADEHTPEQLDFDDEDFNTIDAMVKK